MINGYFENLDLPWEERIADRIKEFGEGKIYEFEIKKERKNKNTLLAMTIENGMPTLIDMYTTSRSGALKGSIQQIYGNIYPFLVCDYGFKNGKMYMTQTMIAGTFKSVLIPTEKDKNGRIMKAEWRDFKTRDLLSNVTVKRDGEGNLLEEQVFGAKSKLKIITKCDKDGRWLSYEEFSGDDLILMQKYFRDKKS